MSRYASTFFKAAAEGRCAFGAFVMLGDPDLESSSQILDALARSGVDMLEVGIPFTDPVADGPVIQAAAARALEKKVTPFDCFRLLASFRKRYPSIPVGILTYANIVLARGKEHFYLQAAAAGVDSVLIADVPVMEAEPFAAAARNVGIAPILIAAPNTPEATLEKIAALSEGYTYCVARPGVTGARQVLTLQHEALFASLRMYGAPPPVLGFGISEPFHIPMAMKEGAAGVICGSALVATIADNFDRPAGAAADFVKNMLRR